MLFLQWSKTCLILAIEHGHDQAAEVLIEPTKKAGALNVKNSVSGFREQDENVKSF